MAHQNVCVGKTGSNFEKRARGLILGQKCFPFLLHERGKRKGSSLKGIPLVISILTVAAVGLSGLPIPQRWLDNYPSDRLILILMQAEP